MPTQKAQGNIRWPWQARPPPSMAQTTPPASRPLPPPPVYACCTINALLVPSCLVIIDCLLQLADGKGSYVVLRYLHMKDQVGPDDPHDRGGAAHVRGGRKVALTKGTTARLGVLNTITRPTQCSPDAITRPSHCKADTITSSLQCNADSIQQGA